MGPFKHLEYGAAIEAHDRDAITQLVNERCGDCARRKISLVAEFRDELIGDRDDNCTRFGQPPKEFKKPYIVLVAFEAAMRLAKPYPVICVEIDTDGRQSALSPLAILEQSVLMRAYEWVGQMELEALAEQRDKLFRKTRRERGRFHGRLVYSALQLPGRSAGRAAAALNGA